MSPSLLALTILTKRQAVIIIVTLIVLVSLPVLAVFSLGTNVISILSAAISLDQTQGLYQGPLVAGDTYAWGNCTYWVYLLRQKAGDPIPDGWGNAADWAVNAMLEGYVVNHIPSVGSIMQISNVDGGLGHVAFVEVVNSTNGSWTISEMNVKGLDIVDSRSYTASAAQRFNFIHNRGAE